MSQERNLSPLIGEHLLKVFIKCPVINQMAVAFVFLEARVLVQSGFLSNKTEKKKKKKRRDYADDGRSSMRLVFFFCLLVVDIFCLASECSPE